jgi:hypothetical protein
VTSNPVTVEQRALAMSSLRKKFSGALFCCLNRLATWVEPELLSHCFDACLSEHVLMKGNRCLMKFERPLLVC